MTYLGNKAKKVTQKYLRKKHRINTTVKSIAKHPRVVVSKSNAYIMAQVIDLDGKVVATIWDKKIEGKTKTERSFNAGKDLAKSIKNLKIDAVAFDRNGYLYHGRVKALADWLRDWGIAL